MMINSAGVQSQIVFLVSSFAVVLFLSFVYVWDHVWNMEDTVEDIFTVNTQRRRTIKSKRPRHCEVAFIDEVSLKSSCTSSNWNIRGKLTVEMRKTTTMPNSFRRKPARIRSITFTLPSSMIIAFGGVAKPRWMRENHRNRSSYRSATWRTETRRYTTEGSVVPDGSTPRGPWKGDENSNFSILHSSNVRCCRGSEREYSHRPNCWWIRSKQRWERSRPRSRAYETCRQGNVNIWPDFALNLMPQTDRRAD